MFAHRLRKGVSGINSQVAKITYAERDKECLSVCRVLYKQWGPGLCLSVALPQTILILKYLPGFKHLSK